MFSQLIVLASHRYMQHSTPFVLIVLSGYKISLFTQRTMHAAAMRPPDHSPPPPIRGLREWYIPYTPRMTYRSGASVNPFVRHTGDKSSKFVWQTGYFRNAYSRSKFQETFPVGAISMCTQYTRSAPAVFWNL